MNGKKLTVQLHCDLKGNHDSLHHVVMATVQENKKLALQGCKLSYHIFSSEKRTARDSIITLMLVTYPTVLPHF